MSATAALRAGAGSIQLIIGPMFSGKSSELIRRVRRFEHARRVVMVVRYAHDTRYSSECVASHDKAMLKAISAVRLADARAQLDAVGADVCAIDEGQMYEDIVEFAEDCASRGITVIVAALDGDFRRKPFGRILELIPLAEKVDKLSAVCVGCYGEAAFTERLTSATQVQLIGGADIYRPVCRRCFNSSPSMPATPERPTAARAAADAAGEKSRCGSDAGSAGSPLASSPAGDPLSPSSPETATALL